MYLHISDCHLGLSWRKQRWIFNMKVIFTVCIYRANIPTAANKYIFNTILAFFKILQAVTLINRFQKKSFEFSLNFNDY